MFWSFITFKYHQLPMTPPGNREGYMEAAMETFYNLFPDYKPSNPHRDFQQRSRAVELYEAVSLPNLITPPAFF